MASGAAGTEGANVNREDCGGDCGDCRRCRAYLEELERREWERELERKRDEEREPQEEERT